MNSTRAHVRRQRIEFIRKLTRHFRRKNDCTHNERKKQNKIIYCRLQFLKIFASKKRYFFSFFQTILLSKRDPRDKCDVSEKKINTRTTVHGDVRRTVITCGFHSPDVPKTCSVYVVRDNLAASVCVFLYYIDRT